MVAKAVVLLKLLQHCPAPLVLLGVTVLAALLDRVLPVLWPRAGTGHGHGAAEAYPYRHLLGWTVPVLLLAVPIAMRRLPAASTRSMSPGAMMVVDSRSSTMAGPAISAR